MNKTAKSQMRPIFKMRQERLLNIRIINATFGLLLLFEAGFMAISAIVSLLYGEDDLNALLISTGVTTLTAGLLYFCFKEKKERNMHQLKKREGYFIVAFVWVLFSLFGTLPFYLSGYIPDYTNAFFETISGYTTTGATILSDIEALPHGLLFWRSIIQWQGGMGIIVLSLAIMPLFGIGGMQMYAAEVPGPTKDKISPRVTQTAKLLWGLYAAITLVEAIMLYIAGMDAFDAICHACTTIATGGFSTKNASIAYWNSPFIDYIIIFFMIVAAMNYTVLYAALRGNVKKFIYNEEIKYYLLIGFAIAAIIVGYNIPTEGISEKGVRVAIFSSFAFTTGTGFGLSDHTTWAPFLSVLMIIAMSFGGCAGSSCGGIKTVRLVLLIKNSYFEFKRLLHPNAIIPVKLNNKVVPPAIITNVLAFIVIYAITVLVGILIFLFIGVNMEESIGAAITSVANVGPGLGASGPVGNFEHFPDVAKWVMAFFMLVGRLDIFTVLFILSPSFWRR